MSHNIRGRIERLEQQRHADPGNGWCPHFWSCITTRRVCGEEVQEGCKGKVCGFSRERLADMFSGRAHSLAMETHPAGVLFRKELSRLGLAQPESLGDIDLYGECIRLVGIPTPARTGEEQ